MSVCKHASVGGEKAWLSVGIGVGVSWCGCVLV